MVHKVRPAVGLWDDGGRNGKQPVRAVDVERTSQVDGAKLYFTHSLTHSGAASRNTTPCTRSYSRTYLMFRRGNQHALGPCTMRHVRFISTSRALLDARPPPPAGPQRGMPPPLSGIRILDVTRVVSSRDTMRIVLMWCTLHRFSPAQRVRCCSPTSART
jgi:hypothetical protein